MFGVVRSSLISISHRGASCLDPTPGASLALGLWDAARPAAHTVAF